MKSEMSSHGVVMQELETCCSAPGCTSNSSLLSSVEAATNPGSGRLACSGSACKNVRRTRFIQSSTEIDGKESNCSAGVCSEDGMLSRAALIH